MVANTTNLAFRQPTNPDIKIWRYMDFAKYVALLNANALHFARLDHLGDPFEGSLSKDEYDYWGDFAKALETNTPKQLESGEKWFDFLMGNPRGARKENYVSCWHMNESESEAMWRLYSSSGFSIAIQSTYELLSSLLPAYQEQDDYVGPYLGIVQYVNHQEDTITRSSHFHRIMHKRLSFQHEKECRAVIYRPGPETVGPVPDSILNTYPSIIYVEVPLDKLVQRVIVSPFAPKWFADTVIDLTGRYGLSVEVERSNLISSPFV